MITHAQLDVQKFASYSESPLVHYSNNMMMYSESGVDISLMTGQNEMNSTNDERILQGLSLSLNTQMSTVVSTPSFQFQYSNADLSSGLSPNLPLSAENSVRQIDNTIRFGVPNEPQYSMNPKGLGFNSYDHEAGIGSTMLRSRFLKAAQQLLDEVVNVHDSTKKYEFGIEKDSNHGDEESKAVLETNELSATERQDLQNNLDKLHSLLDEVDRRYKQYCHQMQILISSFDTVAGGGSAKPYTSLARKTISRHFRCLRDAITTQIQATRKSLGEKDNNGLGAIPRLRYVDQKLKQQRALQQFGVMRHSWRPQRGLPESAVTILRAWLFEHFLHPYPKDSEKIMLARQTGLSRGQVANWFINARVRLWKPMVEEIHKEEFGDVGINPRSSPEHTHKEDVQQESGPSMSHDSKTNCCDHLKGPTSSTSGFNIENSRFYTSAYQMSELGNFSIDNNSQQVSLALGLRGNGDAETSVEVSTSEYPYLEQNSHILNDFVA